MPECLFTIEDRPSQKKRQNGDQRPILHTTRGIDAGREAIRQRGVPDDWDGACPVWSSHSAQPEMFSAYVIQWCNSQIILVVVKSLE